MELMLTTSRLDAMLVDESTRSKFIGSVCTGLQQMTRRGCMSDRLAL
jgi:hypothetical protein